MRDYLPPQKRQFGTESATISDLRGIAEFSLYTFIIT
jgi:hypothetical protein